ncbi:MAG: M3 family oligoendopeptidase [Oscillospiraceae bacterium]|nr:M3 family oligoendopeptidase [Oscillospiraceae bacterium]
MTFSQIPYQRADLDAWKAQVEDQTKRFREAKTFEEADAIFLEAERSSDEYDTMVTLASLRRDIDTRDAFYDAECDYYDAQLPTLEEVFKAWTMATLESPFRAELEAKYGSVPFVNAEMSTKTFSPQIVEDLQKENALVTRYNKLLASAQIPFQGEVYTLSQLSPWKLNPDDAIRNAAWVAEGNWYNEHGAEFDEIYDELVKLRHSMGRKLGYDGYTQLGYLRMQRNCYGPGDIEKFRIAVQKYLVPVAKKLYIRQAQMQGRAFPMNFADSALAFKSGNPKPVGNPQEILAMGDKFYAELSEETDAFWKFMRQHEMLDVESKTGKAGGGYCTRIASMGSPFIFANFNGTSHDVEVVTHEAGHAFACYVNRDRIPSSTIWPSMEGCEVHSMSMEFFAWPWAEGFFGNDTRKFLYSHLKGALCFIPYGTMVDHFQHVVYEHPEFSPEERHQLWRELLGLYMPWLKPGEIPFYGEGKAWQRQSHIYSMPFYYIDYCLAQTVALDFWARIQEDPKAAFETYLKYTKLGGTLFFTDMLKESGLGDPFDEDTLRRICAAAEVWLDHYDLTGIE